MTHAEKYKRRLMLFCGLLLGLGLLAGCGGGSGATDDQLPECEQCHDMAGLSAKSTEPVRAWIRAQGRGLTRKIVLISNGKFQFVFDFPKRGGHPEMDDDRCLECHPVSSEGIRHGIRQYGESARALAFTAGQSCAAQCHGWLSDTGTVSGFAPATGSAPAYTGSLRPHDLLSAHTRGHNKIYTEGYVKQEGEPIGFSRIQPGCAGCHNQHNDQHGTMTSCLDCHRFGGLSGDLHSAHVTLISQHREQIDPDNEDESGCNYCHGLDDSPGNLTNAACYNCHLSGHQPADSEGKAHFWPVE